MKGYYLLSSFFIFDTFCGCEKVVDEACLTQNFREVLAKENRLNDLERAEKLRSLMKHGIELLNREQRKQFVGKCNKG